MKLAYLVFRAGLPWRGALEGKGVPLVWPAFREGQPQWAFTDLSSYIEEGFNLNALIYSAIMYKVRASATAPLRAYRGDPLHPEPLPPNHPLTKLVSRPNPYQSGMEMIQLCNAYFNLAGEFFILLVRPLRGGLPESLHPLRPDRVFLIPAKGGLSGYVYVPEGRTVRDGEVILRQDMIHVKMPNPGDPLEGWGRGLSPLSALAQSGDIDNQVTRFLKTFFQRGTMMSTAITYGLDLTDEETARVRQRWQEIFGGVDNWSNLVVLGNSAKVDRLGMTFDEMGFESIDERNEARIVGPLGVPSLLIETRVGLKRSSYANRAEARRAFWEDTFLPEMSLQEQELQYFLQSEDGGWVAFDFSHVPALQRDISNLVEAAQKLWSMGVPANQAVASVGLDIGEIPGGDVGYLPLSLIPVGVSPAPPKPGQPSDAEDDTRKALKSGDAKAAQWKAIDRIAQSWEGRFGKGAQDAFEQDRREVLALVGGAEGKARQRKATVDWVALAASVKDYLLQQSPEIWRSTFVPLIRGVIEDQGARWKMDFGLQFDLPNLFAQDWFNDYTLRFAQPIAKVSADEVSGLLQQAQAEGWSVQATQNRMGQMFKQWIEGGLSTADFEWLRQRMPPHRTETIARTETMRASNAGSVQIFQEAGVRRQEWLATRDDRVRTLENSNFDHLAADGEVVPIGTPFRRTGEALLYPLDPSGSPGNTINCRCTVIPVIEERAALVPLFLPTPNVAPVHVHIHQGKGGNVRRVVERDANGRITGVREEGSDADG